MAEWIIWFLADAWCLVSWVQFLVNALWFCYYPMDSTQQFRHVIVFLTIGSCQWRSADGSKSSCHQKYMTSRRVGHVWDSHDVTITWCCEHMTLHSHDVTNCHRCTLLVTNCTRRYRGERCTRFVHFFCLRLWSPLWILPMVPPPSASLGILPLL